MVQDKDIKIINVKNNNNLYVADLSKSWDYESQKKEYKSLIDYIPNICDFNKLNYKADTVICINSIHYFDDNLEILIKNLDRSVKTDKFIIQFLDKEL